jgi:peptide deformylase
MRTIVHIPNPILTTPAKEVTVFDKKLLLMIEDMKHVLQSAKKPKGVGLAGPQAGFGYRIFITKPSVKDPIRVFINPKILDVSQKTTDDTEKPENKLEGCLSVPDIWGKVTRHHEVTLSYQDEKGEKHTETFSDFFATIIQHETDHVNGILFTQRIVEQKGKFYQTVIDEKGKEVLEEFTI